MRPPPPPPPPPPIPPPPPPNAKRKWGQKTSKIKRKREKWGMRRDGLKWLQENITRAGVLKSSLFEGRNFRGLKSSKPNVLNMETIRTQVGVRQTDKIMALETMMVRDAPCNVPPFVTACRIHATQEGQGRPEGGLAVLEREFDEDDQLSWSVTTHRLCPVQCCLLQSENLQDGTKFIVIFFYRPPGFLEIREFYDQLALMCKDLLGKGCRVITFGDTNSHIDLLPEEGIELAGEAFLDFLERTDHLRIEPRLENPATRFRTTGADLKTAGPFHAHAGTSAIDHLTVHEDSRHMLVDVELNTIFNLRSDHCGIRFTVCALAPKGSKLRRALPVTRRARLTPGDETTISFVEQRRNHLVPWLEKMREARELWGSAGFVDKAVLEYEACIDKASSVIPSKQSRRKSDNAESRAAKGRALREDILAKVCETKMEDQGCDILERGTKTKAEAIRKFQQGDEQCLWELTRKIKGLWRPRQAPRLMNPGGDVAWSGEQVRQVLTSEVHKMVNATSDGLLTTPDPIFEMATLSRWEQIAAEAGNCEPLTATDEDMKVFWEYIDSAYRKDTAPGVSRRKAQLFSFECPVVEEATFVLLSIIGQARDIPKHGDRCCLL